MSPEMRALLSMRLEQKLRLTTQMIQSIELLQLPLMVLQERIDQELVENPVLENADLGEAEGEGAEASSEERELDRLEDDREEWSARSRGGARGDEDGKYEALMNTAAPSVTLQEHLDGQLRLLEASERQKELAREIIFNLDEFGYLHLSLEEVFAPPEGAEEEGEDAAPRIEPPTPEEVEAAFRIVQSLDPAGVGASTVEECLLLQLARRGEAGSLESRLVRDHLEDLCHNRLPKVAKALGVPIERVSEGLDRIAKLDPRPGSAFGDAPHQYIVPDVIVEKIEDEFVVLVNEGRTPRLRLSGYYQKLLRSEAQGSPAREFLRGKLENAKWLIDAIAQRRRTLERIAREIVEIQRPFMEHGISRLAPLQMQEVARRLDLHVSTVSRALADKYIQTPQGLFPMKFFFSSGYQAADGSSESNRTIMSRIKEMLAGEDKRHPLSDDEIAKRLAAQGFDIARRTVAKYREKLNIPSSRQRKIY